MPRAWSGRDQNCTRILLRLAKSMTALVGAVGAPSVSGVTQKVPRSITSVFFPCVLSAIVATVPPKPVPMTMASKASCAAASLEANAPSPAATAPTAALFTASRRVTDMRSFLVIVASYCLVSMLSPLWRTSFIGSGRRFIRLRSIRLAFQRDAARAHRRRSGGRAQPRSGIRSDFRADRS